MSNKISTEESSSNPKLSKIARENVGRDEQGRSWTVLKGLSKITNIMKRCFSFLATPFIAVYEWFERAVSLVNETSGLIGDVDRVSDVLHSEKKISSILESSVQQITEDKTDEIEVGFESYNSSQKMTEDEIKVLFSCHNSSIVDDLREGITENAKIKIQREVNADVQRASSFRINMKEFATLKDSVTVDPANVVKDVIQGFIGKDEVSADSANTLAWLMTQGSFAPFNKKLGDLWLDRYGVLPIFENEIHFSINIIESDEGKTAIVKENSKFFGFKSEELFGKYVNLKSNKSTDRECREFLSDCTFEDGEELTINLDIEIPILKDNSLDFDNGLYIHSVTNKPINPKTGPLDILYSCLGDNLMYGITDSQKEEIALQLGKDASRDGVFINQMKHHQIVSGDNSSKIEYGKELLRTLQSNLWIEGDEISDETYVIAWLATQGSVVSAIGNYSRDFRSQYPNSVITYSLEEMSADIKNNVDEVKVRVSKKMHGFKDIESKSDIADQEVVFRSEAELHEELDKVAQTARKNKALGAALEQKIAEDEVEEVEVFVEVTIPRVGDQLLWRRAQVLSSH